MSEVVKLPDFVNVGTSQSALIDRVPQGRGFDGIMFERGGTFVATDVEQILVRLGGKVIVDISGQQLDDLNEYYGHTTTTGYHFLWFADPKATRTIAGELQGQIDTQNYTYSDFSIKVKIGASAVTPTLKAWALQSAGKKSPIIRALIKGSHAPGAAGTFTLDVPIGSNQGALIRAVAFYHTNITRVDVKKDGLFLQDEGTNGVIQALQNDSNRVTQAGQIVYDACVNNNQSNAVPTLKDGGKSPANIEFKVTVSAADTIDSYSDVYTTVDNL